MAGSKFAYVRKFELPDPLLPGTFMVFRLDGHSFHRSVKQQFLNKFEACGIKYSSSCLSFSDEHGFVKPNDERALKLMDHAAQDVMVEYKDIVLAFGESDEFRFDLVTFQSL
jgi:tRNA(His) guanylyltransferase